MTQRSKRKKKKPASDELAPVVGASPIAEAPRTLWERVWLSNGVLLLILAAGYILRSILLDIKPPHFDEGINGHFVARVWRDGFYQYDPNNFHGPLYFYFLQLSELLFGRNIEGFRWITGMISLGCVYLIALHKRFFGQAAILAALFAAVSTGFVFYSRYAIHESLFIFCQLLFTYGFFLWQQTRSRKAVAFMVAGVFASYTVKETFFIFYGTWLIAIYCTRFVQRFNGKPWPTRHVDSDTGYWSAPANRGDVFVFACYGALASVALFTGFFLNRAGYTDMFSTFFVWTKTGAGKSGHEKAFFYWIDLMWRYEWPALVALVASLPLLWILNVRQRIVTFTAFGTWLAYSLIPYKTPWLILSMLWPLAFVFGFAIEAGWKLKHFAARAAISLAALVTIVVMVTTMLRMNFVDFTNEKEPYVYVQSTQQMKRVLDYVDKRLQERPEARNMRIFALVRDPWPLPWVFSLYPNLFWGKVESSDIQDPDVILIDGSQRDLLEVKVVGKFWRVPFQIRDSYERGFAYLNFTAFQGIVPSDSEIFERVGGAGGVTK